MTIINSFLICAIGGYILGSIPFGLVLTRICGYGDIRKIGSGNIGATNVLRTGRKDLALLTIILDASKAGIAAALAFNFIEIKDYIFLGFATHTNIVASLIAGSMAIIGHNFPIWLKFKGGKGVASTFGLLVAINWQLSLLALVTWLIMAFTTRYSSLSAITATILVPIYAYFILTPVHSIFIGAIALLILIRHKDNITRLVKGEESKIDLKKKAK
jgi:glycerol-3-phosphate acyltransferase PlsY